MSEEDAAQALSDRELALRFQAGDTPALGHLYDRHVGGIHDFLARFTRDPSAAEDLAHTTFLRAWERRASLRDPDRVRAWLYAMAHNLALNHLTRTRPTSAIDDEAAGIPETAPGPEEQALAREAGELVWAAASSLSARQYAVLDLSVRRGLSTREVADVLGVTAGHAAVLVNRAREALGNAVRYLLVAQRRDHCERLATLVPSGVSALTARQRSAVDHHMRWCRSCQELGVRLTSPAQLLGALLPLPLPALLGHAGRQRLVAAVHAQPAGAAAGGRWPPHRWARHVRPRWMGAMAGTLALLVLGGGIALHLVQMPHPRPAPPRQAFVPRAGPTPVTAPVAVAAAPETPAPGAQVGGAPNGTLVPGSAPSPTGQPGPGPTATPTPAPTGPPAPTPTPAPPPPGPTPTPPPIQVVGVRVDGSPTCLLDGLLNLRLFACSFTITIRVANASGGEIVGGTLTASAASGQVTSRTFEVAVTSAGSSVVTASVSLDFATTCPRGRATVATQPAAPAPAGAPFGGLC